MPLTDDDRRLRASVRAMSRLLGVPIPPTRRQRRAVAFRAPRRSRKQGKAAYANERRALARLLGYRVDFRWPRLPGGPALLEALWQRAVVLLQQDDVRGAYEAWATWQTYRRLWDLKTGRIQLWTGTLDESREGWTR